MSFRLSALAALCSLFVAHASVAQVAQPSAPVETYGPQRAPAATVRPHRATASATSRSAATTAAPHAQRPAAPAPEPDADPFKLTPTERKRLDNVLGYWETRSGAVKTYSSRFVRWEYDAVFGPKDPRLARTKSEGMIRYAAPDKGEFKVEAIGNFQPAEAAGQAPTWPMKPSDHEEHWICDGQTIYELNGQTKQLREERLPPEMQGQHIVDGPLPFMFGAKREKLLARYWMKELVPPDGRKGEYWIEARPRMREDAANFQRALVILDEKQFLPTAMQIYPPHYDGRANWSRTTYAFTDRKVNDPLQRGQEFLGQFISPQVPRGWKKVVQDFGQQPALPPANAQVAPPAAAGQAQRPTDTAPR